MFTTRLEFESYVKDVINNQLDYDALYNPMGSHNIESDIILRLIHNLTIGMGCHQRGSTLLLEVLQMMPKKEKIND